MKLIPFDKNKHLDIMNSWLSKRETYTPSGTEIPEWGCIVTDGVQFIACGFLRQIEGGYAQIDTMVSNPGASGKCRHDAMNLICAKLIKYAKYRDIKGLIFSSMHTSTIERATSQGFKLVPHDLYALDLRSL